MKFRSDFKVTYIPCLLNDVTGTLKLIGRFYGRLSNEPIDQ
jgi:hypothetical protein